MRLAELFPLFGVGDGVIERALRESDHLGADADPPFVERLDGDLVAAADVAEHVGARHPAILQQQLARAARANAELVLFLADGEPGEAALDEEGGDAAVAGFRVDIGKDDEQVGFVRVCDPELPAGQDEIVTRFHGAGRQREGVAARPGFRERIRADSVRRQAAAGIVPAGRSSPSAAAR